MPASSLSGVSRESGKALDGIPHLRQSITDIITTPKGSRIMRPDYGSRLPRMVDLPVTRGWIEAVQADVNEALARWEPRYDTRRCRMTAVEDGKVSIDAEGTYSGEDLLIQVTV